MRDKSDAATTSARCRGAFRRPKKVSQLDERYGGYLKLRDQEARQIFGH